jgi:diguanylate cyclase (GGDEF)-like protein/PAS domain S-box-containing protein
MKHRTSHHTRIRYLLTILLMTIGVALTWTDALKRWDNTLYDLFSTVSYQQAADNVLILAIDENSLTTYGRWPWSRAVHAALVNKLARGGAKAIGYNIFFIEKNNNDPAGDRALAQAISASKRVILPVFQEKPFPDAPLQLTLPIPLLQDAAAGLGHVNIEFDADGIVRHAFLNPVNLGKHRFPALVLAMLDLNGEKARLHSDYTLSGNDIFVSFTGPPGSFHSLSVADFLQKDFPAAVVQDKYILVGTTALGLGDKLPTPVSGESPMPGIEYSANLLSGLLSSSLITPVSMTWRIALALIFALLPMVLYAYLSPRQGLIVILFLLAVILSVSLLLLREAHIWFPPSALLTVFALSYPLWIWKRLEDTVIQLFREKERAQVILHSIGDGVIATDIKGLVRYMNPVAESLTGFTLAEARQQSLRDIFPLTSEDQKRDLTAIVERCLKEKKIVSLKGNGFLVNRENRKHVVQTSAGLLSNKAGQAHGVVLGITDVTETHKMMRQMEYQATHDLLTGLPNRSLLHKKLQHIIERSEIQDSLTAVYFVDLDQFKKVNDQVGHHSGDQLLQTVGKRLQTCCGPNDILAHLGSDKYVIALQHVANRQAAAQFADRLASTLVPPFSMAGQKVFISCHIGICLFPEHGDNVDELLKNADTAMYRAKKADRDIYQFFSQSMNKEIEEHLDIEKKLRTALENDELQMVYQPQVLARNGQLIGAESLIRWTSPEDGPIPPGRFIPVAEDCGLILPMGEWTIRTACRQAKQWLDEGLPPFRIAINLSAKQFLYTDVYAIVAQALQDTRLPPQYLELEITESLIMEDIDHAIALLARLKELGTSIAIDDFGTGYSSLSYLKHFPVDQLKIDQSFVRDIENNSADRALTQAIITMAHGLELNVIAEGVESKAQLAILREQQCDEIQGYYFSRPLSVADMSSYLKKQR